MAGQLIGELKALWRELAPQARRLRVRLLSGLRSSWRLVRASLVFTLQVLAALILLFEEWGWRPLVDAVGRLAQWRPWAALERAIAALPPYAALATLAIPSATLFPLKFVALYLAAKGQVVAAGTLFIAAKLASTALVARLFLLTKPSLMRIGWFAKAYAVVVPWQEAMFALIRESWPWRYGRIVKTRLRRAAGRVLDRWRPILSGLFATIRSFVAEAANRIRDEWLFQKPRLSRAAHRILSRFRGA